MHTIAVQIVKGAEEIDGPFRVGAGAGGAAAIIVKVFTVRHVVFKEGGFVGIVADTRECIIMNIGVADKLLAIHPRRSLFLHLLLLLKETAVGQDKERRGADSHE